MLLSTSDWKIWRLAFVVIAALPSALAAQAPTLSAAQLKQDLDWFRANVFEIEKSYSASARAEAERRLAALNGSLSRTIAIAFTMELGRIVALADNGHSNVFAGTRSRWSNRIPLRLTTFCDEF